VPVDGVVVRASVLERGVRVQEQPVQVRVERGELVGAGALDLDDGELVVPGLLGPLGDLLERVARSDLQFEVASGFGDAD
jgi:hypothetical protein